MGAAPDVVAVHMQGTAGLLRRKRTMLEALGEFGDAIMEVAQEAMSSPWIYLLIFGLAFLDAFFPVVPSETLVITAGVFAASIGEPSLLLVIAAAAAGAFLGDHVSYTIGRTAGTRLRARLAGGRRATAAFEWATHALEQRGGLILVVARYIPGGRTAVTLTCGTLAYPLRKFSFFDTFAALSWGIYSGLIGYFGGKAFEEDPLIGLAVGLSIALGITAVVEIVRYVINRRRRRSAQLASVWKAPAATEEEPYHGKAPDSAARVGTQAAPDTEQDTEPRAQGDPGGNGTPKTMLNSSTTETATVRGPGAHGSGTPMG